MYGDIKTAKDRLKGTKKKGVLSKLATKMRKKSNFAVDKDKNN